MNSNTLGKLVLIVVVIAAVVAVFMIKNSEAKTGVEVAVEPAASVVETSPQEQPVAGPSAATVADPQPQMPPAPSAEVADPLPKLVDLGATTCIPCKKMAPILDQLAEDFAGKLEVVFIDVRKDRAAGVPYKIRVIPTQIFYDPQGNELFRHEGFFSREDILAKWAEFGFDFLGESETDGEPLVTAYYLHWTTRCQTCLEIEAMSKQAISTSFSGQLEAGDLKWQAHDMEQPEYAHFLEDFDLSTPSLVLVRSEGGEVVEFKVLAAVWDLVEDPAGLNAYVVEETRKFMAGGEGPDPQQPAEG